MNDQETHNRKEWIKTRLFEIELQLSKMKRDWITTGIDSDFGLKTVLEEERAALTLEKHLIKTQFQASNSARQEYRQAQFPNVLVKMLKEMGMGDIVKEAERISGEMMEAWEANNPNGLDQG